MENKNRDLLLVIDMQNVYLPGADWACPSMPSAIANTKKLIDSEKIGRILFTQYVAPAEPSGRWQEYNREYREINENEYLGAITANCQLARAFAKDYSVSDTSVAWGGNAGDDSTQGTGISNEGATEDNR